jgi:hyperosmotically inducible protein
MCAGEQRPTADKRTIASVSQRGSNMKTKVLVTCIAMTTLLGSAAVIAAGDSDADRSHPVTFVKDSAITVKVKTKLAADHITSVGRIHVDTDKAGIVFLSGSARSQEAIDRAVTLARETKGVTKVQNDLTVKLDD